MIDVHDLVACAAGYHFGVIDDAVAVAIGKPPGPVCLPYGVAGPKGFGLRHVQGMELRMRTIREYGFASFITYARFVCQEYDWIGAGKNDRLILVRERDSYDHTVVVQFDPARAHWAITTGLPKRAQRGDKLWEKAQAGKSEPSPGVVREHPRLETLTLPKKLRP